MNLYVNKTLTTLEKIPAYAWLLLPILTKTLVYAINRILHTDEAALAMNIIILDGWQLIGVLDFEQAAPLGFLYVTEFVTLLFGSSEYALRLFPFLCGIASCVLLYKLCRYLVPKALPIVMIWFATTNFINRYTTEFKQYSVDLMFALLLTILTYKIVIQKQNQWLKWWTLTGLIAVWFSHASVIVITGTGIAMIIIALHEQSWRHVWVTIVACIITALSFLIVYIVSYQSVVSGTELSSFMQGFWSDHFLELNFVWLIRYPIITLRYMTSFEPLNPPLLILLLFGFIVGLRQLKAQVLLILLLPLFVMFVFSYLRLYPLHSHFLLFTFPAIMLVAVAGWYDVYAKFASVSTPIAKVVTIMMGILLIWNYDPLLSRIPVVDVVGIGEYVEQQTPSATIFVTQYGVIEQAFMYYDEINYQALDRTATLDSLRRAQPIWILEERTHLLTVPIGSSLQGYQSHYSQYEMLLYCIDGTDISCPPPVLNIVVQR